MLTPRQSQLLRLLASGMDLREAAGEMDVAYDTARKHVKDAKARLHTHTAAHTIAKAMVLGIVTKDDVGVEEWEVSA